MQIQLVILGAQKILTSITFFSYKQRTIFDSSDFFWTFQGQGQGQKEVNEGMSFLHSLVYKFLITNVNFAFKFLTFSWMHKPKWIQHQFLYKNKEFPIFRFKLEYPLQHMLNILSIYLKTKSIVGQREKKILVAYTLCYKDATYGKTISYKTMEKHYK